MRLLVPALLPFFCSSLAFAQQPATRDTTTRRDGWVIETDAPSDTGWAGGLSVRYHTATLTLSYYSRVRNGGRLGSDHVVDSLRLELADDQLLTSACQIGESGPWGDIVGLTKYKDAAWYPSPSAAWRLDTVRHRIVAIDPANVKCLNEGYGGD